MKRLANTRCGRLAHGALALLVLQGCSSTTGLQLQPKALPPMPRTFGELDGRWVDVESSRLQPAGPWWKSFGDPTLDELIDKACRDSPNVEFAAAQLALARSLTRIARANQSPSLSLGSGANRQTISPLFGGQPATVFSAGAEASYELDLFGRLAKTSDAAALDADSRASLLLQALLLVQSDVAQAYFELRSSDEERAIVRQTLAAYRDTLVLVEKRRLAGDVAELDVARLRTEVLATESELTALDRRRAELEHGLALLAGEFPSNLAVPPTGWEGAPPRVPPGMPGTLLVRRPDVAAAYTAVLAAQTRVGVARTAWFPDISLSGSGGFASTDLGDLFRWSARAWGIGALLSLPLVDGGRRQATEDNAVAQWNAAAAKYRDQVLSAVREVEDQLSSLHFLQDEALTRAQAVESARRATALSLSRYRNGYVSQLELLDARRTELGNRRLALQVRTAQYRSTISLIRALGGGWQEAAAGPG